MCLLFISIERYVLICRPTEAEIWLTKSRHWFLCVVSSALTLVGSIVIGVGRYMGDDWGCVDEYQNIILVFKCLETILCFLVPATVCVCLSVQINATLKRMLTNQERNQQLTKAFVFTFASWIILWSPRVVFELVCRIKIQEWFCVEILLAKKWTEDNYNFWYNGVRSLSMLFTIANPVIIIIIVRSFQQPFLDKYKSFRAKCCCN